MSVVQAEELVQAYAVPRGFFKREKLEILAVDHIAFVVNPGELFSMPGPSGVGGTMTMKLLPTVDWATVLGHDVVRQPQVLR